MANQPFERTHDYQRLLKKLAAVWESEFRILCHNLGIPAFNYSYAVKEEKKSTPPISLDLLIERFRKEYPYFSLNLELLQTLQGNVLKDKYPSVERILNTEPLQRLTIDKIRDKNKLGKEFENKPLLEEDDKDEPIVPQKDTLVTLMDLFEEATVCFIRLRTLSRFSSEFDYFGQAFRDGKPFTKIETANFKKQWGTSYLLEEPADEFLNGCFDFVAKTQKPSEK